MVTQQRKRVLFEIIGEIEKIETFAVGSAIRERERLRKVYGKGIGVNEKALPRLYFPMRLWLKQKFIGMKLQVLAEKNSR